jgi:hypothetical protein
MRRVIKKLIGYLLVGILKLIGDEPGVRWMLVHLCGRLDIPQPGDVPTGRRVGEQKGRPDDEG